ncbi:hypothetical protein [Uliginosibacterium sediminicola]|uniref:PD(D/E)XK endonuclease domain-containing protein n=1 Tax=Uliginosibacterium sediminicola TaxID=2024550 RepID=A0ABU9Z0F6_9RHOO
MERDKSARGNASQFFVAGELCRRGYAAVVTLGNTPNTDVLCSNREGTSFVHIQVKTFIPGTKTCSVGMKAERNFGPRFFWILAGIPLANSDAAFEYFIIPAAIMSKHVSEFHQRWLDAPGKLGQSHKDSSVRAVNIPPNAYAHLWSIEPYRNRWDLIAECLEPTNSFKS